MFGSWWIAWMVFMFVFFITPIGYGWGYRGWGPPYPTYVQRMRGKAQNAAGTPRGLNHHLSWGLGGDALWLILSIGICWLLMATWWR